MKALWGQAFRPMFLGASLFAGLAMLTWALLLNGVIQFTPYANVMFWHQHEMLFGFVAAVIVGFLLTAVQNWTGVRATHGWSLALLAGVWLAGRLLMAFGGALPPWLVVVVEASFLLLAIVFLASILVRAGNMRNLFFVPVLLLLTAANLIMHAGVWFGQFNWISYGSNAAVFVITGIMMVVSGRVLPMFTANGLQAPRVKSLIWLDRSALISTWLIALVFMLNSATQLPGPVMSGLFALAAVFSGWRLLRIRGWRTWQVPLLWSLHLSVAFIPLGFALFALRYAGFGIPHSAALHALTAGAMGFMILAMMARVALGHSGRPLQPHPLMSVAFLLVALAGLVRALVGWALPAAGMIWLNVSMAAWVIGYLIFAALYLPVLMSPRADGREG